MLIILHTYICPVSSREFTMTEHINFLIQEQKVLAEDEVLTGTNRPKKSDG